MRVKPIGVEHGTVVAITDTGRFEITTLRRDVKTDGRHALVEFTDNWAEDAARRDFTINAMSVSPDGDLFDPAGGIQDLDAGRVRFIGDAAERIREDVLRLLRFFRFSAWYASSLLDEDGLRAAAEACDQLDQLSGERIAGELKRLFAAPDPLAAITAMTKHQVLRAVTPVQLQTRAFALLMELERTYDLEPVPVCRLATALPAGPEAYKALADRLRFGKGECARLLRLARPLPDLGDSPEAIRRAIYRIRDREVYTLCALVAAVEGNSGDLRRHLHEAASWAWPNMPIDGLDLIELGVKPGPAVGKILAEIEKHWLYHDFKLDRAVLLDYVRPAIAAVTVGSAA